MRRIISTIATVCFMTAGSMTPAAIARDEKLDQVLGRMQESAKMLKTIKARIQQDKLHTQTGGREVYKGKLIFKRLGSKHDKVRIDYEKTDHVVALEGEKITLYQPRVNQAFITCRSALVRDHPDFSFITALYASVGELKATYTISYVRDDTFEGAGMSVLELVPRVTLAERKTVMWVNQQSWMPIRFEVTERNGDVTTLILRDIVKNQVIDDRQFHVSVKPGTKEHKEC